MLVYWLLFGYFAAGALFAQANPGSVKPARPMFVLGTLLIAAVVGFRYRVGADWINYKFMFADAANSEFLETLQHGDPAYQVLSWIVEHAGGDILIVNIVCAVIFAWGLFRFCAAQPVPWAAAFIAIPYTVIVVAMGYTRQGVALGLLMAGLASFLRKESIPRFAVYVFLAALFHRTAVVAFPIVALATDRNRAMNLLVAIFVSILLYDFFLGDAMEGFVEHYIKTRYSSQGAVIRVAMNLVAVGVFWLAGDRLRFTDLERRLWRNFCFATIGLLIALIVVPSSTAVDRMSLYVLPLQIAVMARLPLAFRTRMPALATIVAYMFAVQFVWFNFAQHSKFWVPYEFYPF